MNASVTKTCVNILAVIPMAVINVGVKMVMSYIRIRERVKVREQSPLLIVTGSYFIHSVHVCAGALVIMLLNPTKHFHEGFHKNYY